MNLPFFIFALFGLQAIYWIIGKRASQTLKGKDDYFLAGKKVRFFPLFMTFLATQVGGGLILGASDEAYKYGWSVLLYPIGQALGFIALSMGAGKRLAQFPISTVAQIFEVSYNSSFLKKIASSLSIVSLFMVLVGQIIGSKKFLAAIGFSSTPLFVLFWAVLILYTARGGLKAVIATDISQALFFCCVFFLCFAFVFGTSDWPASIETFADSSQKWSGWLLMPFLFMIIEQDMGQRCFAGNSPKTVSKACLWAGVATLIIGAIPVFFGILARKMGILIPEKASVLMIAIGTLTNPWISAIIGCAIIAAIISTASSLINAISSNLSQDFFQSRDNVNFMRLLTALLSVAAIFFAFFFNNVVDMLIQSYELSLSCLFVPIFIALFKRKGNFFAAALSILFGFCSFCFFKFAPAFPIPSEISCILISLLGFGIGELVHKKKQVKMVQ